MKQKKINEAVFIYGKHAVAEALAERPDLIMEVWLDARFSDVQILGRLHKTKAVHHILNEKRLPGGLRSDAVHQGIVAAIDTDALLLPYKSFIAKTKITNDSCFLVLGEVQDPHNVGAMIRSAAAFGVLAVLIPPHNQAPVTGTVVKVSAGMAFKIPLVTISNVNATLHDLKERGCWVYGLAGEGATPLPAEHFEKPSVIVVGNEGSGIRQKTRESCDVLLTIPMHPRTESLNAAAAVATVLYAWSSHHAGALSPRPPIV